MPWSVPAGGGVFFHCHPAPTPPVHDPVVFEQDSPPLHPLTVGMVAGLARARAPRALGVLAPPVACLKRVVLASHRHPLMAFEESTDELEEVIVGDGPAQVLPALPCRTYVLGQQLFDDLLMVRFADVREPVAHPAPGKENNRRVALSLPSREPGGHRHGRPGQSVLNCDTGGEAALNATGCQAGCPAGLRRVRFRMDEYLPPVGGRFRRSAAHNACERRSIPVAHSLPLPFVRCPSRSVSDPDLPRPVPIQAVEFDRSCRTGLRSEPPLQGRPRGSARLLFYRRSLGKGGAQHALPFVLRSHLHRRASRRCRWLRAAAPTVRNLREAFHHPAGPGARRFSAMRGARAVLAAQRHHSCPQRCPASDPSGRCASTALPIPATATWNASSFRCSHTPTAQPRHLRHKVACAGVGIGPGLTQHSSVHFFSTRERGALPGPAGRTHVFMWPVIQDLFISTLSGALVAMAGAAGRALRRRRSERLAEEEGPRPELGGNE